MHLCIQLQVVAPPPPPFASRSMRVRMKTAFRAELAVPGLRLCMNCQ